MHHLEWISVLRNLNTFPVPDVCNAFIKVQHSNSEFCMGIYRLGGDCSHCCLRSQFIQNALFLLLANSVNTGKCFHPDREHDLEGMKADAQFYHLWVFVEMNSSLPQLVQGPMNLSPFSVLLRE